MNKENPQNFLLDATRRFEGLLTERKKSRARKRKDQDQENTWGGMWQDDAQVFQCVEKDLRASCSQNWHCMN